MSDDRWLTDHLLGEGDAEQRSRAERRIAGDPALAARAAELRDVIDQLEGLPATGWTGLGDHPAEDPDLGHPQGLGAASPRRRGTERRGRRRALAALAVVCVFALGLGAGALVWSGGSSRGAIRRTVVLRPVADDRRAHGLAQLTADGRLRLSVAGLPLTADGQFYEAWLMTDDTRLVPLAAFRVVDGATTLTVLPPAAVSGYRYIDVSLQRAASGPAHSGHSLLRGPTGR